MNKFVKIKGFEGYFMVISSSDELPENINDSMHDRLKSVVGKELTSKKDYHPSTFFERFNHVCHNKPNYKRVLEKYADLNPVLLIRSIGSYMLLNEKVHEIDEVVYSIDFPDENKDAEIVVCENDMEAEKEWIQFLKKEFPNKKIRVLNFFGTRSTESIKNSFSNAKFITFSTTFTSLDWWRKLNDSISDNHVIIGYCHNKEGWKEALDIASKEVTIIDKL